MEISIHLTHLSELWPASHPAVFFSDSQPDAWTGRSPPKTPNTFTSSTYANAASVPSIRVSVRCLTSPSNERP